MPSPTLPGDIEKLIGEFLDYLAVERGSSPLTLRNYKHYLTRFAAWTAEHNVSSVSQVSPQIVQDYRVYLSQLTDPKGKTLSRKTQGYHAIALRSFLKYLSRMDYAVMAADKIELPKIPERQIQFMTGDTIDRLLNAPSLSTIGGKRDKAILELFFSTGLRVSELTRLNRDDIDFDRREFGITGKGGKARVVFLSSRAAEWLKLYIQARKDHYKPLFIRHRGPIDASTADESVRLTPRSVQRLVKKYSRKVKIPLHVTPHSIRHAYATDLLIAGADIRSVQEMLGHKNIATTQIYTHVTNKHLKEIHEKYHGASGEKNSSSS